MASPANDWRQNTTAERYDSVSAFLRRLEELPIQPGSKARLQRRDNWSGNMTYDEAKDAIFNGYAPLTERVTSFVNSIDADQYLTDAPRIFRPTVVGPIVSVPAYLAGLPECMLDQSGVVASAQGPVTICINRSASAGISNEVIERAGAAVCALALTLQRMRPVEIVVVGTLGNYSHPKGTRWGGVPIINLGVSPFDADQLAFILAHPSMLRVLQFAWVWGMGGDDDGIPWAWGLSPGAEMEARLRELCGASGDWIYVAGQHLEDGPLKRNPEQWVKDQIEKLTKGTD